MSEALQIPTQAPTARSSSASEDRQRRLGWRRLQAISAAVTIASFVIPMAIEAQVEVFLVVMAAPFMIGLALVAFLPRVASIFLGVVSVATIAFSAPFTFEALRHPESVTDFIPQTLFLLSLVIATVAAIPSYREVGRGQVTSATPRSIAITAGVVAVAACAFAVAAATGIDSVAAEPGDKTVITSNFAFAPAKITTDAGSISVHVTNQDSTRHTFTIAGLTDLSVPPNSTQRVTFEAPHGTYRFYCRPHESDMDGVLVAE